MDHVHVIDTSASEAPETIELDGEAPFETIELNGVSIALNGTIYCCAPHRLASLKTLRLVNCGLPWPPEPLAEFFDNSIALGCHLETLELTHCGEVASLPNAFGQLTFLKNLILRHCSLPCLPDTLGQLGMLEKLILDTCYVLTCLPDTLGQLAELRLLDLSYCAGLRFLPESLGLLLKLESLQCNRCRQLTHFPAGLGALASLRTLAVEYCDPLCKYTESLGKLTMLESALLYNPTYLMLSSMCNIAALRHLELFTFHWLELPQRFSQLNLSSLQLKGACFLCSLLGRMVTLTTLVLRCQDLTCLPDSLCDLSQLVMLDLHGCHKLTCLPALFGQLRSLVDINLSRCTHLTLLPASFGDLCKLQRLDLSSCGVENLPPQPCVIASLGRLRNLATLVFDDCKWMVLPDAMFHQPSNLKSLMFVGRNSFLQTVPGQLSALTVLTLAGCRELTALPENICYMAGLTMLSLCMCFALQRLPASVGQLTALENLNLTMCYNLTALPDSLGCMLRTLRLPSCIRITSLPPFLGLLPMLAELDVNFCCRLQRLPASLCQSRSLRKFTMVGCEALVFPPREFTNDAVQEFALPAQECAQERTICAINEFMWRHYAPSKILLLLLVARNCHHHLPSELWCWLLRGYSDDDRLTTD